MDAEERDIYYYLKPQGVQFVPVREVGRQIGSKRRWRRYPDWATSVLERMAERGILEGDKEAGYRVKPAPRVETFGRRWLSPEMAEILKANGKMPETVISAEADDEYYDRL